MRISGWLRRFSTLIILQGNQFEELSFVPEQTTGLLKLDIGVSALPGEATEENNRVTRTVKVIDDKINIEVISTSNTHDEPSSPVAVHSYFVPTAVLAGSSQLASLKLMFNDLATSPLSLLMKSAVCFLKSDLPGSLLQAPSSSNKLPPAAISVFFMRDVVLP